MTLTTSAHDLLTAWTPPSPPQRLLRDAFLEHVDGCEEPWSRANLPDHLTASVIVVDEERTRVLLGLHRKVGKWLQFGGHIEPDDRSIAEAARREAVEESGIADLLLFDSKPVQLDRHPAPCGPAARFHLDI